MDVGIKDFSFHEYKILYYSFPLIAIECEQRELFYTWKQYHSLSVWYTDDGGYSLQHKKLNVAFEIWVNLDTLIICNVWNNNEYCV